MKRDYCRQGRCQRPLRQIDDHPTKHSRGHQRRASPEKMGQPHQGTRYYPLSPLVLTLYNALSTPLKWGRRQEARWPSLHDPAIVSSGQLPSHQLRHLRAYFKAGHFSNHYSVARFTDQKCQASLATKARRHFQGRLREFGNDSQPNLATARRICTTPASDLPEVFRHSGTQFSL